MRRLAAAVILTATLLAPSAVTAHHAPVEEPATDKDAQVAFLAEYIIYRGEIIKTLQQRNAAVSGPERSDLTLKVENQLAVALDHLESLTVADCFAVPARAALEEFRAATAWLASLHDGEGIADLAAVNRADGLAKLLRDPVFHSLFVCEG